VCVLGTGFKDDLWYRKVFKFTLLKILYHTYTGIPQICMYMGGERTTIKYMNPLISTCTQWTLI